MDLPMATPTGLATVDTAIRLAVFYLPRNQDIRFEFKSLTDWVISDACVMPPGLYRWPKHGGEFPVS
jgi:hypothetical protein